MKYLTPDWPAPEHIKAFTTTRQGWGAGDNGFTSSQSEQAISTLLQLPSSPCWLRQTHSTIAIEATLANKSREADASFTSASNHVCIVLTADCLPLLVTDKEGTQVAAIHAGWRGLAAGIIENTLKQLTAPPADLLVWLGPAIGPHQFEVGKDVFDAFTADDSSAESAFTPLPHNKWLANLYALAAHRLKRQGVHQLFGGDYCTYTYKELFYSYRRDQGKTGRMASVIWIED